MRNLFRHWPKVKARLEAADSRLFLFDFDGTLAPICARPEEAKMSKRVLEVLKKLVRCPKNRVGILSGRSLHDVRGRVSIRGIYWGGNHGQEIDGPRLHRRYRLPRRTARAMCRAYQALRLGFRLIPGAQVENKDLSISLHYRRVRPADRRRFFATWRTVMKPILAEKDLIIQDGKCVYEVRPRSAPHKGTAAAVLRRCVGKKALMVYVGDDRTDEDVFRQLTRRDVGVRVGFARGSKAAYAISAQADVRRFLAQAASCC